jgi:hypothetical protein
MVAAEKAASDGMFKGDVMMQGTNKGYLFETRQNAELVFKLLGKRSFISFHPVALSTNILSMLALIARIISSNFLLIRLHDSFNIIHLQL